MSAYDTPQQTCPYCSEKMDADWVDVGVGMVQCGPYHCYHCGASEIGPESEDWCYKDRDGRVICTTGKRKYFAFAKKKCRLTNDYSKRVLKPDVPITEEELETGFYKGRISPYANTVGGQLVDHKTAKEMYGLGLLDEKHF